MLIRNVGHLMTNPAILLKNGEEVPEGIMDAFFTVCISIHELIINTGSYINAMGGLNFYNRLTL